MLHNQVSSLRRTLGRDWRLETRVRPDGKEIVIDSNRPGGLGMTDIWAFRRRHPRARWSQPINLGPAVNSPRAETRPSLLSDGTTLYFGSTRGASQDVFTSTRTP